MNPQTLALKTNIEKPAQSLFPIHSIDEFLPILIQIALVFGSIAALMWLLWGGIEYIMAGGNQDRTKGAKEKITQAVAGLAILAAAWVIWRLVVYFLGISDTPKGPFKIQIPTP